MSSYSDSEPPADDSIRGRIIRQQADKLAKMSALGDLVQEQREEDRRGREEDARRVMDAEEVARVARARAARKAAKKAKRKARERDSEESPPRKKKAQVHDNGTGPSATPTVEADEGMEFPEAPCKRCVYCLLISLEVN